VAAPFLLSSLYIDRYGVEVPGKVYAKSEYMRLDHSTWSRRAEVTVEYWPPDSGTVAFFNTAFDPAAYDTYHKGQAVTVHYLKQSSLPKIPMAATLGQMRILPVARIAGRSAFSNLDDFVHGSARTVLQWVGGTVLLLVVWRLAGWPRFGWAVGVCALVGLTVLLISEFPRPTPAPVEDVRQATGRVTNIRLIDNLYSGNRTRGFIADQPIQIVSVEFVPAGRTDPVMAIDAIDAGSIPSLQERAQVTVDYEAAHPRTAYLRAATRAFPSRNLRGIGFEIVASLAVLIIGLLLLSWLGRAWKRLVARR
jgi:hypothetical protein